MLVLNDRYSKYPVKFINIKRKTKPIHVKSKIQYSKYQKKTDLNHYFYIVMSEFTAEK